MIRQVIAFVLALTALGAASRTYSVQDVPNVQLADHTKHLSNPDGIVSAAVAAQIDSLLLDARRKSSAEVAAVIVDDIDADDIDGFATNLFNSWGLGKSDKNNGVLLLVAKDRRRATIRTGYGAEGLLPDILAGRILHDTMFPKFREGDYEGGMLAGVKEMHRLLSDPQAVEELMSAEADNYRGSTDGDSVFNIYLAICCIAAVAMLAWVLSMMVRMRGKSPYEKYSLSTKNMTLLWIAALLFMGIPLIAPLLLAWARKRWRNGVHRCPRCNAKMSKLDEDADNQYLDMAQDLEEKIASVDYDVWLCPKCGETDIYSFVNKASAYKECPSCHARAYKLSGTRVLAQPTYSAEGVGEKVYVCLNCNHHGTRRYSIPKKERPAPVILPIGGGRSGGGFGGGFGGGITGGGGASGGW